MVVCKEYEAEKLRVIVLSDLHLGEEGFLRREWYNTVNWLRENPDVQIVLAGDLTESITKASLGDIFSQQHPMLQIEELSEFLSEFKNRIIAKVIGNHEWRIYNVAGINISEILSKQFEIPFCAHEAIIDISLKNDTIKSGALKRLNYVLAVRHGWAGGRYAEKSVRQGRQFAESWEGVDVLITGHTHHASASYVDRYVYDRKNKGIGYRRIYLVNAGAYLEADYAKRKGLPPSRPAKTIIELSAKGKKEITILLQ